MTDKTITTDIDEHEKRRAVYVKIFQTRFLYYMDQRYTAASFAVSQAQSEASEFMITAFGSDWADV